MTTWRELTYASAEAGPGRSGGWGVISSSPEISPSETKELLSGVAIRIDEVDPTDEFASRAELDKRVRSLAYSGSATGGSWWHSVVAGKDATGRPGNVFTHAASATGLPQGFRPVEAWGSPDWLMPFGPAEVAAAEVSGEIRFSSRRESALDFLMSRPVWEIESVLAAVSLCFEEDRPLVLACRSTDEFIEWLTAISFLTSAAVARMTPFMTYVRADALTQRTRQFEILGLPQQDLAVALGRATALPGAALVVDVTQLRSRSDDGSWQFHGQIWNSGAFWQDSFYRLAHGTRDQASDLVTSMDQITADLDPREVLHPEWPLALALLKRDGPKHADSERTILEWNRRQSLGVITDPELRELLAAGSRPIHPVGSRVLSGIAGANSEQDAPFDESVFDGLDFARPSSVLGNESSTLRDAFSASIRNLKDGMFGSDYGAFAKWYKSWLTGLPLVAALDSRNDGDRKLVEGSIALFLGVPPVRIANELDRSFAVELKKHGELIPDKVIDVLSDWIERYDQLHRRRPARGEIL